MTQPREGEGTGMESTSATDVTDVTDVTALVRHEGEGHDRARSWADREGRRRRVMEAAQTHDADTLLSLADAWLTLHSRRKAATSPLTRESYRQGIRALLTAWQHVDLLKADGDAAALWLDALVGKDTKPAAPSTITRYRAAGRTLYMALRWAEATTADPFKDTRVATDPTPAWEKRFPYEEDELRQLILFSHGADRALILLGAHAGLRVSEMLALRWDDIDLGRKHLVVRHGKGGKRRTVSLSRSLLETLKDLRESGERFVGERAGYVLPYGAPISARRRLGLVCEQAGVAPRGIHSLRHAAGTRVVRETGSLEEAAHHLGHVSIETTRVYAKWSNKTLQATVGEW